MANDFTFPTLSELTQRMQTDVQTEFPNSNPFLPQSWLKGLIVGLAGRYDENYIQLNTVFNALFLPTASDDLLDAWGSVWLVTRLAATQSSGSMVATGTPTSLISLGETLSTSSGLSVEVQANATITTESESVTLNRDGTVVTATSTSDLLFTSGQTISIAGADQAEYNGDVIINMIDINTFTYTISTQPITPATGTITASANMAVISVLSTTSGSTTNTTTGTNFIFDNTITGIDPTSFVSLGGLTGGNDTESNDNYRVRILNRIGNPVANFNVSQIEFRCFEINGVTRVWVQSITPTLGAVTIYFVRDNDIDIIPDSGEITTVKNNVLLDKPASDSDNNIIVAAPTPIDVNFNFVTLVPNSTTMQAAVTANLTQYFREDAGVGNDLLEVAYNSVIFNTIDPNTGEQVSDFTLASPIGNVGILNNEIGILNSVTF